MEYTVVVISPVSRTIGNLPWKLPRQWIRAWPALFLPTCTAVAVAIVVAWAYRSFALDDAFITYRVAQNVAAGHGLVYNVGEPTLSTTAPGYAVALAIPAKIGLPLTVVGALVSVTSLAAAGGALWSLGVGPSGLLLLASSPVLLATLGMETCGQVVLVLLGLLSHVKNRPLLMMICLALAVMVRPDAAVPAGLIVAAYVAGRRKEILASPSSPITALLVGCCLVAALYGLLWWRFGSPIPSTLSAKVTQRGLGFYGYVEGARLFAEQALQPWWRFAPLAAAAAAGVALSFRRPFRWNLVLVEWACLHSAAYVWLNVAGYAWYYAPIAVAVSSSAAVTITFLGRWPPAAALLLLACLAPQVASDIDSVRQLPDPRLGLYRQAGEWLGTHAASDSSVGVMEVGVVGYFSGRTMIDFAGLTRPATVAALSRGDLFWSIAHYEPAYLVLTNKNPLYSYDLQDDPWFQATYRPVTGFHDDRWWGSPVTIFESHAAPPRQPVTGDVGARYGADIRLESYALDRTVILPGQFIHLTARWTRLGPATGQWKLFAHLIDQRYKVYGGNDATVEPTRWPLDQSIETEQFISVPGDLVAGRYLVELGWYDPTTLKRLPVSDTSGKPAGETVVLHDVSTP